MREYLDTLDEEATTLAPLIRLFFGELIATLRASMPDPEQEPWPVKIMLDKFDQLGPMPIIVSSLKQLAGHGGRVSIITQSVPGLESTPYSENERLGIESAAGIKLYLAPNEKKTAGEISESLGKTTKLAVSDSLSRDGSGLLRRSISRRNEERPLMTPDELKKLDRNKVILVPERQHPVIAHRIVYYEDPYFREIMAAQKGPLPYPSREAEDLRNLREKVEALNSQIPKSGINLLGPYEAAVEPEANDVAGAAKGGIAKRPARPALQRATSLAADSLASIETERPLPSDAELQEKLKPSEEMAQRNMQAYRKKLQARTGAKDTPNVAAEDSEGILRPTIRTRP